MAEIAVYPGSFDPVTNGHLDIIKRSNNIFDKVIVAVFNNPTKRPLFDMEERVEMLERAVKDYDSVEVDCFAGLLTTYLKEKEAKVIVRGLRAVSDFESEFQMASMNKKLASDIETIFMMTSTEYAYLSSSIIKEVASFEGCVRDLIPEFIVDRLFERLKERDQLL
ncbi:pantetheine-phosphate adenylyltransferase [Natroniella sulfidigena]|uniref:pantetheine-phosphate adenylyltransferase n=1 Tax=Natroniella sulfidigena TaxID=723921 RepID=UPI00200AD81C|nr:pantetheine-phosphate adenylyltransferase [Natroniella sulfidigena]MCK8818146.1 pantetheine-phosphate adenylyltransferase [Natroniella sulfidigena]